MPKLTKTWRNRRTFLAPDETADYVKTLNVCVLSRKETKRFSKVTYQCSVVRKFDCKYQVQVVCPHDNLEHQVSESGEHVHLETVEMSARQLVKEQALKNRSAKDVRDALNEKQLPIPDDRALYNMMYHDRVQDSCIHSSVSVSERFRRRRQTRRAEMGAEGMDSICAVFQTTVGGPNWFQGAALGHPSTDNGLEATNGEVKKEHTIRKALPLGIFLDRAEIMLRKFSVRSLENGFKQQPESRKEEFVRDMTAGFQFSQDRTRVITPRPDIATVPDTDMYFIESKDCCCSVEAYVAPILQGPDIFTNFDDYHRWLRSYYIVENARGWWFCTCPVGLRDNLCKHTIGIQARFHGLEIPARCRSIPLGQVRGPGRPKKVAAALVRD